MLKKTLFAGGLTFAAMSAFALDEAGLRYVKMFANGGPSSIRSAAESIYNTGNTDQEVLDAAAEALITNYRKNRELVCHRDDAPRLVHADAQPQERRREMRRARLHHERRP